MKKLVITVIVNEETGNIDTAIEGKNVNYMERLGILDHVRYAMQNEDTEKVNLPVKMDSELLKKIIKKTADTRPYPTEPKNYDA